MHAIACDGLTRDFGSLRAVDSLSLAIPAGCIFTLLGPNGAGKTTTIHLLLGLLTPTAGRAEVLGHDPQSAGDRVRADCGVLLEHHGLYERLTAEENVEFYGRLAGMSHDARGAAIRRVLEHFGLWERRRERVGTWSRGMKQKLAIARAILHRPPVLFLDEPTSGLDPEAVVSMRDDVVELARAGTTIFLNTHNLTDAEMLSDLIGVMRKGKLLAIGTPDELRSRGRVAVTIVSPNLSDEHVSAVRSMANVAAVTRNGDEISIELDGNQSVAPIVRTLVERGAAIEEVRREAAALEDVFLQIVREESA